MECAITNLKIKKKTMTLPPPPPVRFNMFHLSIVVDSGRRGFLYEMTVDAVTPATCMGNSLFT